MAEVDKKISKQMSSLIELLTTSGKPQLNPEIMKKFKKICRTSDMYVQHAFDLLLMQLTKNHSEIRLSTFQMIDEVFNRSHAFRVLVIENFQTILELTVGTDSSLPIPPPKTAAKTMKTETCRCIQKWYEKFKDGYTKLILGFEFLKADKKADFEEVLSQIQQERQIEEENKRKVEQAKKDKLEKVEKEMNDGLQDIKLVVTEVENGLELLMPHPDNFFIGSTQSSVTEGLDNPHQSSNLLDQTGNNTSCQVLNNTSLSNDIDSKQGEKPENNSDKSVTVGNRSDIDCDSGEHPGTSDSGHESTNKLNGQQKDEDNVVEYEDYSEDMRGGVFTQEHGLLSRTVEITVDVGTGDQKLKVTEDNADIVQDVKEKYKLIKSKYLNYVKRWIQVITNNNGKREDITSCFKKIRSDRNQAVKPQEMVMTDNNGKKEDIASLEALKPRLEDAIKKCLELDIISVKTQSTTDSDSEDDFEDVPEKEGYEEDIPEHIKLEAFSKASTSKQGGRKKKSKVKEKKQYWMLPDDDISDPTTILLNLQHTPEKSKPSSKSAMKIKTEPGTSKSYKIASTSSPSKVTKPSSTYKGSDKQGTKVKGKTKEELLDKAPVKTFGVDLEHWENPDKIEAPLQVKYEGASRFWVPDKEDEGSTSQEQVAALTMRTMTFTGEFEPVKWKCRAPLPDGRLCERMDRKKCPFHGKIIPRDELGQPTDPEDIEKIIKEDLKQGSGDDSGSSSKGKSPVKGKGKAKKRKYPNLTDITVTKNCRQRLESKIFNKSTLKRVNQCLDAADMKKVTDKFSNQFNYSLK